jgi:DNA helicase-2/ATP-dependent DNA helicase PcrA
LEQAFLDYGVPYRVLGTRFFERKEVKDLLSYLKAAVNPESRVDLARIIAMPPRGIGKGTFAHVLEGTTHELPNAARKKVDEFFALLTRINETIMSLKASEAVRATIDISGLGAHFMKGDEESLERLGNIRELATLAAKYDALPAPEGIEALLEEAALLGEQDSLDKSQPAVSLMTVHASKGLEFDMVFVSGLEEGLFPMERNGEQDDPEEERRLFYVALTRARKKVFLSHAATRMVYGNRDITVPSGFIADIDPGLISHKAPSLLEWGGDERTIW